MTTPLIDTHCHLDYFEAEIDAVLERARAAGVARLVTIGCANSAESMDRALAIARRYDHVWATVGVHPHDASNASKPTLDALEALASDPKIVAVGETGLDFHYDHSPRDVQRQVFRDEIAIARRVKKPIVVHTRTAPEDTLAILREENARDVGGIIHCFSEDPAFAKAALDLGFVASFSGIATFPKATGVRDAAKTQPLDAILVETDAPYLAPIPHRGKRNEPAYVAFTCAEIARLRGVDPDALREATTRNACRVLGLPPIETSLTGHA